MSAPARIPVAFHEHLFSVMVPEYESDINCLLEFNGQLDFERLTEAVLAAIADTPLWGYRYVPHWRAPYWQQIPRPERRQLITLLETSDPRATEQAVLAAPVHSAVHVTVMRTSDRDILCLRVDHRLADATGSRGLLATIWKNFREQRTEPATDGPLIRLTFEALSGIATQAELRELLQQRKQQVREQAALPVSYTMPRLQRDDVYRLPRLVQYPAGTMDQIRARAMQNRATPPMVLQAAAFLAFRDVVPMPADSRLEMPVMIDLRRYLPKDQPQCSASMLIGMSNLHLGGDAPADLASVLPLVAQELKSKRGRWFGLIDSPLILQLPLLKLIFTRLLPYTWIRSLLRRRIFNPLQMPGVTVTEQGDFGSPGDQWGDTELTRGFCSTGVWKVPSVSVGFSTSGTQLTISVATGPDSFSDQLVRRIDHHLRQYMEWPDDFGRFRQFGLQPESPQQ
jgi:NRPS condensation-like uncharacterized protein